ncbi:MAG: DUF115 domain-containing protein [Treponema sp.]|nr:DUF115 domain-containing protein [Treponema sp.]
MKEPSGEAGAFWEANLRLVRRQYPGLAEQVEKPEPAAPAAETAPGEAGEWDGDEGDIKLEYAAGLPVLSIRGIHIHSHRDPEREARRLAESLATEEAPGPLLILGFGLAYGAEAAAARYPGRPLIIVERHAAILRKALESRNLASFLSSQKIVFVLGGTGEGINAALGLFEHSEWEGKPLIVKNRALISLNGNWYGDVERRVETWISRGDVNQATLRRFGKRWVRNLSRNMEAIRDLPGISLLENLMAPRNGLPDIPVFLAAAGPSLDRCAGLLPEIRRRCLVLAVDTSLRFLLKQGVDPDFVLSVDPQYWNSRHLDRSPAPHTRLIAESAVYPPVLRQPFRQCFLCGSLFPLGRFIEDRVDPKGRLGAGGSVATTAWDFARSLGTRTIWTAGLDLAYPDLKTHFRGALFEDRSHAESGRRSPAETWSVRALRDGQPFKALSRTGGPPEPQILTDRRLSLYASWFEAQFRRFPELRSYRLFPGGLAIRGLEDSSPQALLALPGRREEINRRLEEAAGRIQGEFFTPPASRLRAERYEEARKALLSGLEHIKTTAEWGAAVAAGALRGRQTPAGQEGVLKTLDETNRRIMESEVKDVAGFLFPPLTEPEEEPPGGDPFRRHLELSVKLYRALAEAAEYNAARLC